MMVFCAVLLSVLCAVPSLAMSDDDAYAKAKTIWGPAAKTAKSKESTTAQGKYLYEVGCNIGGNFIIVASGISWESAFAKVDLMKNGQVTVISMPADPNGNIVQIARYQCTKS